MNSMKKLTSLAMVAAFGMWGCSSNQYATNSGESYDDLYGSSSSVQVAARANTTQQDNRYANPDYQESNPNAQSGQNADYYDESYMTSRNMPRRLSDDVGYNAGFREGYYAGQSSGFFPGYMNYGSYWPMAGSAFSMGFQMGISRSLRFGYSPFSYGMGYSPFGYGSYGYSPWGYSGYDAFGYSPYGYGSYGYSPFGYGSMAYGYGGYGYSPFGYGGFGGYNPYYGGFGNQLIVVNNNYDQGRASRGYGPRSATARSNETYNRDFTNTARTSRSNGGREAYTAPQSGYTTRGGSATSSDSYYARPRANSSGTYYNGDGTSAGRTSSESRYSGRSNSNSQYYSTPRSSTNSSRTYQSSPTYNQSRGNTTNSTYQAPRQSSWENSSRSTPTPSYNSNSSRGSSSMSSPSSSSSSSGASAPRSRGPR
ncbi:hypothetical protein [Salmonirosea aquatica]|uniref:Prolyl-tRNA synthetase n=1 Tax=Salmonirosea aquatica TaxID=2654236 RepID=A0A7C9FRY6_9BACT|nr:hypothetical protein [Cytophagaceae bacterium SJW1-29]